jgi:hypothetical protein
MTWRGFFDGSVNVLRVSTLFTLKLIWFILKFTLNLIIAGVKFTFFLVLAVLTLGRVGVSTMDFRN